MNDITKIKVDGEPESSYQLYPRNEEFAKRTGGAGGTDISLGLTSTAVGQIIKVKAIDDSGKPTAWETVDMPSGGGGGVSVPKPLTYDYMPAGYPTKSVQTTTLMEEQELEFAEVANGIYGAFMATALDIVGGQTYTVNWDGAEYECVCVDDGKDEYLGNKSIFGSGDDTGEPFLYDLGKNAFATLDTSAAHTISVKRIEETVTPMAAEFLPNIVEIDSIIMKSYTPDSTKKFKITVNDSGTLTATEVT